MVENTRHIVTFRGEGNASFIAPGGTKLRRGASVVLPASHPDLAYFRARSQKFVVKDEVVSRGASPAAASDSPAHTRRKTKAERSREAQSRLQSAAPEPVEPEAALIEAASEQAAESAPEANLTDLSRSELAKRARARKLSVPSKASREDIVELILNDQRTDTED